MRRLDEKTLVAGQIGPEDLEALKDAGVRMIVNNRPDGEEFAQPPAAEIEAKARSLGLEYRFIPISSGFTPDQVNAMASALRDAEGEILAFCRSGTRSTFLWALARSRKGDAADELMRKAASAGYDLGPIAAYLAD